MRPLAPPCGRPEVMYLTVEDGRRELAGGIDRRPLPQEQPLERQLGMCRIGVWARGVAIAVAGLMQRANDAGGEMPSRIGEVIDQLAKLSLQHLLRPLDLLLDRVSRFQSQAGMASGMRSNR